MATFAPATRKHERRADQDNDGWLNVADHRVDQRHDHDRHQQVVLRIRRARAPVDDRQLGPRLADGDARCKSSYDVDWRIRGMFRVASGSPCERGDQRQPDVGVERIVHIRLRNPENPERGVSGEPRALIDECRVVAHTFPESRADAGDELGTLDIVAGFEQVSVGRPRGTFRSSAEANTPWAVIGSSSNHGVRCAVGIVDGGERVEAGRLVLPHQVLGVSGRYGSESCIILATCL